MSKYQVCIRGEYVEDDGLVIDSGRCSKERRGGRFRFRLVQTVAVILCGTRPAMSQARGGVWANPSLKTALIMTMGVADRSLTPAQKTITCPGRAMPRR